MVIYYYHYCYYHYYDYHHYIYIYMYLSLSLYIYIYVYTCTYTCIHIIRIHRAATCAASWCGKGITLKKPRLARLAPAAGLDGTSVFFFCFVLSLVSSSFLSSYISKFSFSFRFIVIRYCLYIIC